MSYTCSSGNTGITNELGELSCENNDTVTLHLGELNFEGIELQTFITPYTLFPNNEEAALNLSQLFQTLDTDNNKTNDIIKLDEAFLKAFKNIDFTSPNFDTEIQTLLGDKTLVSEADAKEHLKNSFVRLDINNDGSSPRQYAPAITSQANISINENQTIALTITASDENNDTLTYSLTGTDANNFNINSSTGVVSFKVAPDFESGKTSYGIIAKVNDGSLSGTQTITITILDINEYVAHAPVITSQATISVNENQTTALSITATDENNDTLTYSLTGTDANDFNINSSTGVVSFKTAPDFESGKTSYSITANVSDATVRTTQTIIITILDVSEYVAHAPLITSVASFSVAENQISAFTATATDANGDSLTYSLFGTDVASFNLNSSTGVVTFQTAPDYESGKTSYSLIISVTDGSFSVSKAVTISIIDVAEATVPTLVSTTLSIAENAADTAAVGNLTISTTGGSVITAITLSGTGDGNFSIATNGDITVANGASLDYETKTVYNLNAIATNASGSSTSVSVTINITNTGEHKILSAVYDNKRTAADVTDDVLYLYMSESIDPASINADRSRNYTVVGTGTIHSGSASDYNDTRFHLNTLNLSGGTAFVTDTDTIIIKANQITDASGLTATGTTATTVRKFKYIKKTGQTDSYDASGSLSFITGDDGHYETGVIPSYTRDPGAGIVTDNLTGLMWQDDILVPKQWLTTVNYNTCSSDTTDPACYDTSGDTAETYCTDLSLGIFNDWRMPTSTELEGIVDYSEINPSIDSTFTNTSSYYYYSSTTYEGNKNDAWVVYFDGGYVYANNKNLNYYVRCVRDGQ